MTFPLLTFILSAGSTRLKSLCIVLDVLLVCLHDVIVCGERVYLSPQLYITIEAIKKGVAVLDAALAHLQ